MLKQSDIDRLPLGDGAGHGRWWKFWLAVSKYGTWIACGILCLAFWFISYQGIKLLLQYWR